MIGLGGISGYAVAWQIDYKYIEKGRTKEATHIIYAKTKNQAEKLGVREIRLEHPNATSLIYRFPKRVKPSKR